MGEISRGVWFPNKNRVRLRLRLGCIFISPVRIFRDRDEVRSVLGRVGDLEIKTETHRVKSECRVKSRISWLYPTSPTLPDAVILAFLSPRFSQIFSQIFFKLNLTLSLRLYEILLHQNFTFICSFWKSSLWSKALWSMWGYFWPTATWAMVVAICAKWLFIS